MQKKPGLTMPSFSHGLTHSPQQCRPSGFSGRHCSRRDFQPVPPDDAYSHRLYCMDSLYPFSIYAAMISYSLTQHCNIVSMNTRLSLCACTLLSKPSISLSLITHLNFLTSPLLMHLFTMNSKSEYVFTHAVNVATIFLKFIIDRLMAFVL